MMLDIFSGFDDHLGSFWHLNLFLFVWLLVLLVSASLLTIYWSQNNTHSTLTLSLSAVVNDLTSRTEAKNVGGFAAIFSALFMALLTLNLFGLTPYIFSLTSHLAVNLVLSLPLWAAIVLMSMTFNLGSFLAHLQPSGSPSALNPFLCIIELVSLLVRPLTLAVRLTANLSTGHILMALLGTAFTGANIISAPIILLVGTFYFMFEMAVCFIQAYIFTLLPTLYADEHPSDQH